MREEICEQLAHCESEDEREYLWYLLENADFAEDYE